MAMWRMASVAISAIALAACGGGSGGTGPVSGPAPSPSPSPSPSPTTGIATVVFADGFDGASLDRSKWNVVGTDFWVNNEQQAYLDSPDTLFTRQGVAGADGGVLVVKPVFRPGTDPRADRKADFISGRIDTSGKFDFQHGRSEARIRMSAAPGFWPAFWTLGYGDWPNSGEIDTMEYVGEKDWVSAALHGPGYSGDTPLVKRFQFPAGEDATGWHVYAVDWNADRIVFEVDGRPYYTVTRAEIEKYGPWRFDNKKYLILNSAVGGIYPFNVNKITSPYYGLPQATVDAIKAGTVEMEVDWVKVTQIR